MGGNTFYQIGKGRTVEEAFRNAVEQAQYENGHGGYTGTLAEKHSYVVITLPEGIEARDYATLLIDKDDERIEDKWGPAGALPIGLFEWLFFGWANS